MNSLAQYLTFYKLLNTESEKYQRDISVILVKMMFGGPS